ncbi:unnamed protein product [Agarophyton chilense]
MFRSSTTSAFLTNKRTLSTSASTSPPSSGTPPPPSAPTPAPRPSLVRRGTPILLVGFGTGLFLRQVYSDGEFRASVENAFPPSAKFFSQLFDLLPKSISGASLRTEPISKETTTKTSDNQKSASDSSTLPTTYHPINKVLQEAEASLNESSSTTDTNSDPTTSTEKEPSANHFDQVKPPNAQIAEHLVAKEQSAITDKQKQKPVAAIELPKVEPVNKENTTLPKPVPFPAIDMGDSAVGSEKEDKNGQNDAPVRSTKGKLARLLGKGDFEASRVISPDLVDDSEYMKPNLGNAPSISIFDSIPSAPELPIAGSTKALTVPASSVEQSKVSEQQQNEVEALRSEIRSQLKWEAVRLQEAVRSQLIEDKKIAAKEVSLMAEKHSEELTKVREDAMIQAERVLVERTLKIREEAQKQRDDELNKMLAEKESELRETLATEYAELQRTATEGRELALTAAKANVSAISGRFEALVEQTEKAKDAARRASSAFMLQENIASSQPFGKLLKDASGSELGRLVSESVPPSVASKGVSSVDHLKQDFRRASRRGLSAALVPESEKGTIWGHLLGAVFSRLKIPVDIRLASNEPPKTNEERIRLAKSFLDEGNLGGAVATLDSLNGLPGEVMADWLGDAKARIAAQQAAEVLLADAIIAQISLTKGEDVNMIST